MHPDVTRVLIVDDWQWRHDRIKRVVCGLPGLTFEFRHRYAPSQVSDDDWRWAQFVFLDHDMCLAPFGMPCPSNTDTYPESCRCPTGVDAVRALVRSNSHPWCVVHSANPVGGANMTRILLDHGYRVVNSPVHTWAGTAPAALHRLWGLQPAI